MSDQEQTQIYQKIIAKCWSDTEFNVNLIDTSIVYSN